MKREQYKAHITKMLQYIDYTEEDAKVASELILKLETQLAEPRLDKVARRDIRNRCRSQENVRGTRL